MLESAVVRSEMEVVLRCENDVQLDALTVVDFTMLYVVWLAFHCWCHAPVVIMVASKENKLPPSFSGFKSKKFVHESSYDGVSGTDNDKQSIKILSKCLSSLAARSVLLI